MPPDSAGEAVFQTMPRSVTGAPPLALTVPPKTAVVVVPRVVLAKAPSGKDSRVKVRQTFPEGSVRPDVFGERLGVLCGWEAFPDGLLGERGQS